jgi:hypothetical protein
MRILFCAGITCGSTRKTRIFFVIWTWILKKSREEKEKKKGKRGRKEMKKRERFAIRCIIAHFVDKTSLLVIFHSLFIPSSITLPTT